jgi:hypothetical protein
MQKLINHLQSLRRSSVTIKDYELYLNSFLVYLNRSGVYALNEIKERHILTQLAAFPLKIKKKRPKIKFIVVKMDCFCHSDFISAWHSISVF